MPDAQYMDAALTIPAKRTNPWFVMALIFPLYFLSLFYRMVPSIIAPELASDFGVDMAGISLITSMTWVSYGLMQLPSGILVDALGGRNCICFITGVAVIGNIWFATATTMGGAIAARLLVGIGCAVTVPCFTTLAQRFPASFFSRANGIFLALGLSSTVFAGAPLAMASASIGWRNVLIACAGISFIFMMLLWFFIKEPTSNASPALSRAELKDKFRELFRGMFVVLKTKAFWPCCIWFSCVVSLYFTIAGLWWGPYLREGCGLSIETAGGIISVISFCTIPAQPVIASISDYLKTRKKVIITTTLFGLLATIALPLWGHKMSTTLLTIQGFVFVVSTCHVSAVLYAVIREIFPLTIVGTALGLLQGIPYVFMVPLLQNLYSRVLSWRIGSNQGDITLAYSDTMFIGVVIMVIATVASFFVKETLRPAKS